eukprot:6102418-Lingulodinium_polyedra.AAC.1
MKLQSLRAMQSLPDLTQTTVSTGLVTPNLFQISGPLEWSLRATYTRMAGCLIDDCVDTASARH